MVMLRYSGSDDPFRWYSDFEPEDFRRIALALANRFIRVDQPAISQRYFESRWRRSLTQAELCAALAPCLGQDPERLRKLGLVAGFGHHLIAVSKGDTYIKSVNCLTNSACLLQVEEEMVGSSGAEMGARQLATLGFASDYVDAVRYQYAEIEALQDASDVVKAVAYSGRLIDSETEILLPGELLTRTGSRLLGLDENQLNEAVVTADKVVNQILDQTSGIEDDVASFEADLAQIWHRRISHLWLSRVHRRKAALAGLPICYSG